MRPAAPRICSILVALAALCSSGQAQETPASSEASAAETPAASQELLNRMGTPRLTLRRFMEQGIDAQIECLDLSQLAVTEDTKQLKGQELAYKLKETLNKILRISYVEVPNSPEHSTPYSLSEQSHRIDRELIGQQRQQAVNDLGRIVIARGADQLWRFTPETVADIEVVASHWGDRETINGDDEQAARSKPFALWLEEQFPKQFRADAAKKAASKLYVAPFQWTCLAVLIVLGFLADVAVRGMLNAATAAWLRLRNGERSRERKRVWRPMGLLTQACVWYYGTKFIGLPVVVLDILLIGLKAFTIIAAVWTAFRLVELLAAEAKRRAARTETKFDDIIIPMVARSLKFVAVCIGLLTFAQAFSLPLAGLIGGLGIGGMALAFAAQDAVSNFFGSVTVLFDRPFEVGDWVITDGVEGTVESVGFRSTRIRTFYNSLITLPNSRLTTVAVDNMGRRQYRRIKAMLGLQYDTTPDQIDAFCEGVRELIRRHPYTRKDYYHVYFNQFAGDSLNVLLYCFVECPDWAMELRERHRLFVDILQLAKRLDVSFAFPTRTLHLYQEQRTEPRLPDLSDAALAGQQFASQITGPPLPPDSLPGAVQF